ncbi:hypothetical protein [Myroides odoratimimus]|uniref:hypothetical protein n=1 Tax=Myroides odoratimimus TaxID=76832 RepID=UPI00217F95F2|nr:hypothetical protein [Myroides odoratimimus]MCS7473507.1 hypothetical protein [Myroides odoratimimus]MDM1060369.1 hypothetical protein [Myroides odoratimimus]
MEIVLYPKFEEVFIDDTVRGIFYPLCTVELASGKNVHFVSHNGIWTNDESNSDQNSFDHFCFSLKEGKYVFSGDITLYKGYKVAQAVSSVLEEEFWTNADYYFKAKMSLEDYTERVIPLVTDLADDELDLETYLEFFYAYSLNKLVFQKTGQFAKYRQLIDGFGKADPSPYVYKVGDEDFDTTLRYNELSEIAPASLISKNYFPIGMTIGCEFFTDGNDCVLYYNEKEDTVICLNTYS